jgi:hypothetical protein
LRRLRAGVKGQQREEEGEGRDSKVVFAHAEFLR